MVKNYFVTATVAIVCSFSMMAAATQPNNPRNSVQTLLACEHGDVTVSAYGQNAESEGFSSASKTNEAIEKFSGFSLKNGDLDFLYIWLTYDERRKGHWIWAEASETFEPKSFGDRGLRMSVPPSGYRGVTKTVDGHLLTEAQERFARALIGEKRVKLGDRDTHITLYATRDDQWQGQYLHSGHFFTISSTLACRVGDGGQGPIDVLSHLQCYDKGGCRY